MWKRPHPIDPAYVADPLAWNPLLDGWLAAVQGRQVTSFGLAELPERADALLTMFRSRDTLSQQYACSVPTGSVIRAIVQQAPRIVELGAGTGYWAKLLSDAGADVLAFDVETRGTNDYFGGQPVGEYFPVHCGTPSVLRAHTDRALLLVWPPYAEPMAIEAVEAHGGDLVIFVGEGDGGCCADDAFFEKMATEYERVAVLDLPQWEGIHDAVWIWRRAKTRRIELEA